MRRLFVPRMLMGAQATAKESQSTGSGPGRLPPCLSCYEETKVRGIHPLNGRSNACEEACRHILPFNICFRLKTFSLTNIFSCLTNNKI